MNGSREKAEVGQWIKEHRAGVDAATRGGRPANDLGVEFLTHYAFSTKNWVVRSSGWIGRGRFWFRVRRIRSSPGQTEIRRKVPGPGRLSFPNRKLGVPP